MAESDLVSDVFRTVCVIATAEQVEPARLGSSRFMQSEGCAADTPEKMLTIPLSPTGQRPTTHWLCTRPMTEAEIQRQAAAVRDYPIPVQEHVCGIQASHADQDENEARCLASLGLKRIAK